MDNIKRLSSLLKGLPTTRGDRDSVTGGENVVLFITGAGLSKASGIPTYRSNVSEPLRNRQSKREREDTDSATWSRFVYQWGTRAQFLKDPLAWYNTFWLQTHHRKEYLEAEPSKGHISIAKLCKLFPAVRVVTQNIDGLHSKGAGAIEENKIVEVHGHLTYYKCINEDCVAQDETFRHISLEYGDKSNTKCKTNTLRKVPICPKCKDVLLPQSLFFDEDYESHPFYQYEKVETWMESCKAVVFIGTSNSVGITTNAVLEARRRSIPVRSYFTPLKFKYL